MKCPSCKSVVVSVQTVYFSDGKKAVQCRECPEKAALSSILSFKQGSSTYSSSGKMTAAHNADIERRKVAPDGRTVYRDYGQKSFVMP